MRRFSPTSHGSLTRIADDPSMEIEDPAVPAVAHLTGDGAADVVGAAVTAAGGTLHAVRVSQIQYRPGSDLVVRYRADVTWADGRRREGETLLAATGTDGPLTGAIPVEAHADGNTLVASVWRWPFDPVVVGLEAAATPGRTDQLLLPLIGRVGDLEVVAYRPTERAVVRVTGVDGRVVYVKALPPRELPGLVDRHRRLLDAGVPVPEVLATAPEAGLVVLAELAGTTLRERIKSDLPAWPSAEATSALLERIHALGDLGPSARGSRIADARGHARLLQTLLPHLTPVLDAVSARFAAEATAVAARSGVVVHGDLHEGQLIVDDSGAITGLLDIDDLGAGDPVDDVATLLGHLHFRAALLDADAPIGLGFRLRRHLVELRRAAVGRIGAEALDVAVAAVLVGLATGPFRIQRAEWRAEVEAVVADAAALAGCRVDDMRDFSARPHEPLTTARHGGERHRDNPRRKEAL